MEKGLKEHIESILYFYHERGLERYCHLEKALEYPELADLKLAYNSYRIAEMAVSSAIKELEEKLSELNYID